MGTSYVKFRDNGFWVQDRVLSDWLRSLIGEMRQSLAADHWLSSLISHWEIQREVHGGCMALDLDRFLADEEKRRQVISAAESALMHLEASQLTGRLFLALLKGEVKTNASSPIDYL